jgi:hypothetical protein
MFYLLLRFKWGFGTQDEVWRFYLGFEWEFLEF